MKRKNYENPKLEETRVTSSGFMTSNFEVDASTYTYQYDEVNWSNRGSWE